MPYADKVFCQSDCINVDCDRHPFNLPPDPEGFKIKYADFSGCCEHYVPDYDYDDDEEI